MKRIVCSICAVALLLTCSACAAPTGQEEAVYKNITAEEAKRIMDTQTDYIILDVRTEEEFAAGHIPEAILIPDDEIEALVPDRLPDKSQLLLVYCRSGRRSKLASETLVSLGYTNIYEFGGILDWPYAVVCE